MLTFIYIKFKKKRKKKKYIFLSLCWRCHMFRTAWSPVLKLSKHRFLKPVRFMRHTWIRFMLTDSKVALQTADERISSIREKCFSIPIWRWQMFGFFLHRLMKELCCVYTLSTNCTAKMKWGSNKKQTGYCNRTCKWRFIHLSEPRRKTWNQ